MTKCKSWWGVDDWVSFDPKSPLTMSIEAQEQFDNPCGFVRLKERHRVKAIGIRYGRAEQDQE